MQHPSLETVAKRLSESLHCEQQDLCRPIIQQVARGKPVTKAELQVSLHLSQDELEHRLARLPDTEFDQSGNIVGCGVTLLPTHPEAILLSVDEAAQVAGWLPEIAFRKQTERGAATVRYFRLLLSSVCCWA